MDALREPLIETALGNYRIVCATCWRGSRNSGFIEETPQSKEVLRVRIRNFRPDKYEGGENDSYLPNYDIIGDDQSKISDPLQGREEENNCTPQEPTKKGDALEKYELEMAKMATGLKKRKTTDGEEEKEDDTRGAETIEVKTKARKKLFDELEKSLDKDGF